VTEEKCFFPQRFKIKTPITRKKAANLAKKNLLEILAFSDAYPFWGQNCLQLWDTSCSRFWEWFKRPSRFKAVALDIKWAIEGI